MTINSPAPHEKKDIVIVGGGIIGCTTAYYLTRHKSYDPKIHSITLIEATRIAGGASGKAGGLLAVWAYPSCIVDLSFKLHRQLAKEHGGAEEWGFRALVSAEVDAIGRDWSEIDALAPKGLSLGKRKVGGNSGKPKGVPEDLDWILPELIRGYGEIGDKEKSAQVHPYQFTRKLLDLAEQAGVRVIYGSVTELQYTEINHTRASPSPDPLSPPSPALSSTSLSSCASSNSRRKSVESVTYIDRETKATITIPATTTILAAGPWTSRLYPQAPIAGLRAHSVTVTPTQPVSAYALFTNITIPSIPSSPSSPGNGIRRSHSPPEPATLAKPEIYARPNEIYICGEGDIDVDLPATTADVEVDEARCDDIISQVSCISDHIRLGKVTRKQACYLPIVSIGGGGGPLLGETGCDGLLLASGHSCWGINNAPATGLLLSEIVFEGQPKSADIRTLDPRRIL